MSRYHIVPHANRTYSVYALHYTSHACFSIRLEEDMPGVSSPPCNDNTMTIGKDPTPIDALTSAEIHQLTSEVLHSDNPPEKRLSTHPTSLKKITTEAALHNVIQLHQYGITPKKGTTYYWQVDSQHQCGKVIAGPLWHYTTQR